jgi:hypothetical protein
MLIAEKKGVFSEKLTMKKGCLIYSLDDIDMLKIETSKQEMIEVIDNCEDTEIDLFSIIKSKETISLSPLIYLMENKIVA